jgi:hypothetical protein
MREVCVLSFLALLAGIGVYGDSIALGAGEALHVPTHARVGMGSCWIKDNVFGPLPAVVVLSAGINDPPGACLESLREAVGERTVIWILPAPINSARRHVESIAARYGDLTVSYNCSGTCTPFNFHPASYGALAGDIVKILARLGEK